MRINVNTKNIVFDSCILNRRTQKEPNNIFDFVLVLLECFSYITYTERPSNRGLTRLGYLRREFQVSPFLFFRFDVIYQGSWHNFRIDFSGFDRFVA
jgi:hypothetical protein